MGSFRHVPTTGASSSASTSGVDCPAPGGASLPHRPGPTQACLNPFTAGQADWLRDLLASYLKEPAAEAVLRGRARALMVAVMPVLTWARDHAGVPITQEGARMVLSGAGIDALLSSRALLVPGPQGEPPARVTVASLPDEQLDPLRSYLEDLPGFDPSRSFAEQRSATAAVLHSTVLDAGLPVRRPHPV